MPEFFKKCFRKSTWRCDREIQRSTRPRLNGSCHHSRGLCASRKRVLLPAKLRPCSRVPRDGARAGKKHGRLGIGSECARQFGKYDEVALSLWRSYRHVQTAVASLERTWKQVKNNPWSLIDKYQLKSRKRFFKLLFLEKEKHEHCTILETSFITKPNRIFTEFRVQTRKKHWMKRSRTTSII